MQSPIKRVEGAIDAFKQGKMVVVTDDPERENEGDLIVPAELITPELMSFMIRHGSGIVCLSMIDDLLDKIELPLMVPEHLNTSNRGTPFTLSIDARSGITTGVSANDRVHTILSAISDRAKPSDFVKPGHMFPLRAKSGGVFEREGHTEGAIDLARIAGYKPAAVLCEIMNDDGTMSKGENLIHFAKQYELPMLSIDDILTYRFYHEDIIEEEITSQIQLEKYGYFDLTIIREKFTRHEHAVLCKPTIKNNKPTLVRIHSSCTTGDIFSSRLCDCNKQLHHALSKISEEGGLLIYLQQEGRNIGLFNKIKSYALQQKGLDTVDANIHLGFPVDARKYFVAANILRNRGIDSIRLMTNNPAKISDLHKYGLHDVMREPMPVFYNHFNKRYLDTKRDRLNHIFNQPLVELSQ